MTALLVLGSVSFSECTVTHSTVSDLGVWLSCADASRGKLPTESESESTLISATTGGSRGSSMDGAGDGGGVLIPEMPPTAPLSLMASVSMPARRGVFSFGASPDSESDSASESTVPGGTTLRLQIGHVRRLLVSHGSMHLQWKAGRGRATRQNTWYYMCSDNIHLNQLQ